MPGRFRAASPARRASSRRSASPRRAAPARRSTASRRGGASRSAQVVRVVLEAPAPRPTMNAAGRMVEAVIPGKAKF